MKTPSVRTVLLLIISALAFASCQHRPAADSRPPVLLLISLDAFRWDYFSLYPNETPQLRKLRDDGASAESLIPAYPSNTFPNHYSIVTGLYPSHHGIINNEFFSPREGTYFHYNVPASAQQSQWWQGEPIWVTAIRHGLKAACAYWIGSEVEITGIRPTFWRVYDPRRSFETRLAELGGWLQLPPADRPAVITFYLEETNSIGHKFGPDSPELAAAIARQDDRVGQLLDQFKKAAIPVNVVVVSDHGITPISKERVILLDDFIDQASVQVDFDGSAVGLRSLKGDKQSLLGALAGLKHAKAYLTEDLPSHLHISPNPRNPDVWIVPEAGWEVYFRSRFNVYRDKFNRADHGYDPALPSMHGIFLASGPSFRSHVVVGRTENIHVYNLLCAALKIPPAPNDGDDRLVRAIVRP